MPEHWISEGRALCEQEVYSDHILKLVAEAEGRENLGPMNPPNSYDRKAGVIAKRRALEAGYRLAALLNKLFGEE